MKTFIHLTFKCDLDLEGSIPIFVLWTSPHDGYYLFQVFLKKNFSLDGRTDGRTDRQTEAIPIIPSPLCGRELTNMSHLSANK